MMREHVALKRFSTPEEIAGAIVYLVGPGTSKVTGTALTLDGGLTLETSLTGSHRPVSPSHAFIAQSTMAWRAFGA